MPVIEWLKGIDTTFRRRINSRLTRIVENGNFGDFKQLDDNISELRFNFGSGYRIYFSEIGDIIILLLCAGDKNYRVMILKRLKNI